MNSMEYVNEILRIYEATERAANDTREYWDDAKQRECYSTYVDPVLKYLWDVKKEMESIQSAIESQLEQARRTCELYLNN